MYLENLKGGRKRHLLKASHPSVMVSSLSPQTRFSLWTSHMRKSFFVKHQGLTKKSLLVKVFEEKKWNLEGDY